MRGSARSAFASVLTTLSIIVVLGATAWGDGNRTSKHQTRGVSCEQCHGVPTPDKQPTTAQCLQCHESYDKVASLTKKDDPNPHASHQGELRCTLCHKEHARSVLSCNECHQYTQSVP